MNNFLKNFWQTKRTKKLPTFLNINNNWFRAKDIVQIIYEKDKFKEKSKSQITFYLETKTQVLQTAISIENEIAQKLISDLNEDLPGISYVIEEIPQDIPEIKLVEEYYIDDLGNQVIKKVYKEVKEETDEPH